MSENQLVKSSFSSITNSQENIQTTTTTNRTSSITSSIGQLIRLNLPNIGNQLRRFIGLTIYPILNDENHGDNIDDNEASNFPSVQQDLILNSSRITQTISIQSFNFYDYLASEIPTTSSYSTHDDDDDDNDYDGDDDDDSIFTSPPGTPAPLMISSGVNTGPHIFISRLVSDDGVIITGNPNDFVAALNARVGRGINGESQVPFEPQRIPLFFSSNENRNYAINSVAINSISSSSSGSWSSSDIDDISTEFGQSESFRQRQNEARQFYENNDSTRQSVKKHFRNLDDEPPIY